MERAYKDLRGEKGVKYMFKRAQASPEGNHQAKKHRGKQAGYMFRGEPRLE